MTARDRLAASVAEAGGSRAASKRVGCTRAYVDMILADRRRPGMRIAHAIEGAFGIRMQEWMQVEAPAELAEAQS